MAIAISATSAESLGTLRVIVAVVGALAGLSWPVAEEDSVAVEAVVADQVSTHCCKQFFLYCYCYYCFC